jgi:transcription elongation factor SPT6
LKTTQSLVKVCAEQVGSIEASLRVVQENIVAQPGQANASNITSQICRDKLWHRLDYQQYVDSLTDYRHIMDLYNYLSLLKEGNDAIQNKDSAMNDADKKKKRSRRFDRDYYRTCVSQGLRRICYKFALGPFRTGIKLEDNIASAAGFNWDKTLPGENSKIGDGESDDPRQWNAPVVKLSDPTSFASDLVSSGELVLLASMNDGNDNSVNQDHPDVSDPLRGCRYVAAMELAYEPRIRRHLRDIYKRHALLTTRPSPKGMDSIDFFHEYYGLHLIHNKKVADHFYPSEKELEMKSMGFSAEERKEMNERTKVVERQCCLQYLNVMKAEKTGHVKVDIHLPFTKDDGDDWYNKEDGFFNCRDNQDLDPFMEELRKVYYPSDGDHDEWNNQREQIIRFALKTFLLPYFEMEVKRELREVAYKMGIRDAGDHLYGMSMEGPYRPSHLLGDNRFLQPTGDLPIVGVCCSSDAKEASFLAAITERGDVIDHLAVPAGVQIDSHNMREKVITFLMQSRPSAIVVGSHAGLSSRLVARKLGALATEATERWNNRFIQGQDEDEAEYQNRLDEFRRLYPNHDDEEEENEIEWKCNVEMVDDNVAQLFGRSVRGKKEFPDSTMNRKCAIAIARHAKDPLAELTYTWSVASDAGVFGTEMLFLNVHPMQRLLPKTLLLREYERVLCRAVAEVGVDVNFSCKYDHARGLLSFVPGFGPRKAASLKHGLERIGGVIATRKDLLSKRLVGPFVYNNAVAFLRVRDIDALSHQNLHPLDDTRLHPHVYHVNNWAIKIAIDALEMENDDADNAGSDERGIMAIKDIMEDSRQEVHRLFKATKDEWERVYGTTFNVGAWDPRVNVPAESWRDKVEELDLDTFAHMIEKDGKGKWLSHLTMIKWEFRLPFEDPRKPMEPLEKEKLFQMLTGESDQTLCPGREVTGKVARISDFGAHLKLEGDVPAFIPNRDLADGHVESAEGFLQIGQIVTAIVTAVKKDHMSVDLSLKEEDLQQAPSSWERPMNLAPLDQFFDKDAAKRIEEGKSKEREERLAKLNALLGSGNNDKSNTAIGRTGRLTNRACTHPVFRNKSHMEVEKELKEEGLVGDALVRPSKTNADALSLHWLVREGFTKIIEIQEEDKDNDASIGNTLKIKNDTYGSIDELLARYVGPMNDRVEELLEHRKFENKSEAEVDKVLQKMKEKSPNGVFYGLCWNEKYPGYASLRFVLNATARYHHIGITPEGFNWCQTNYSEIDYLLNAFKKNPRGKSPNASTNEGASRSSRTSSERISRFARAPSAPRQPPKWTSPSSSHNMVGPSAYNNRPPPPSLPPPSQHAYPPVPPGNPSWNQQRPQPPSLPPPPQHRYPPVPPAPPGYPSQ